MKTKNIINTMAVTAAILLGFQARASENVIFERSENYKCEVKTTDGKNYLLDVGYSIVTEKKNYTGTTKKISFSLTDLATNQNTQKSFFEYSIDGNPSYNRISIVDSITSLKLQDSDSKCLRPGCYTTFFKANLQHYRLTTLIEFKYEFSGDGYYDQKYNINLDIAQSKCEQVVSYEE